MESHRRRQLPLDDVLDGGIDGQIEILAGLGIGRREVGGGHGAPPGIAQHGADSRLAGDLLVVEQLEPGQSLVVGADIAQDLGGQLAHRVVALALREEVDPAEVELAHRRGDRGIELARHPDELPVAGQLAEQVAAVETRNGRGEGLRGNLRVLDLGRYGIDGIDLHRDGELTADRVVDRATRRVELDDPLLLPQGFGCIEIVAHHLELVEAQRDQQHPAGAGQEDDMEPRRQCSSSQKISCSKVGGCIPISWARFSTRCGLAR